MLKRRDFINLGISMTAGYVAAKALFGEAAHAQAGAKITEKDILREGQPTNLANFCEHPEKQPNKVCPDYKSKPGNCKTCMFYNTDKSETSFNGGKYARCQLLADPKKAQYVSENAYCSTFVKKQG